MHQSKDTGCQSRSKNKTKLYVVYKKSTLNMKNTLSKDKWMEKNMAC